MSPPTKRELQKGAYGYGVSPEDYAFLKIDRDPRDASASGHSENAHDKYNDDYGYKRGQQSMGGDEAAFLKPSWTGERDDAHEKLAGLIDDSQPYDPLLPGGAALTKGKGVGAGKPRYAPKQTKPYRTNGGF